MSLLPSAAPGAGLPLPLLVLVLSALLQTLAPPTEGRQPGDPYLSTFQNSLQNALSTLAIPRAPSFSATLAATTRFFASFSSTATSTSSSSSTILEPVDSQGAAVSCVPGETGAWPVPGTSCSVFYRCGGGTRPLEYKTCPPGKVYYAEYQDCEYPTSSWRCWEPICTGRVDGLYPDWSTHCRRSVNCQGGRVTAAIGCPAGQLSAGRSGCRPAVEVSCPRVSEGSAPVHLNPFRPVVPPSVPAPAHPLCFGRSPSLTQDRSSRCRQYFRCSTGGQRTVETCPGQQVFDGSRCLDPQYYSCAADHVDATSPSSSAPCDRLPDGLHPQPGSHCRAYFRCSLGYKSVFVCSGDSLFDGDRCVPNSPTSQCAEDKGVATLRPHHFADGGICAGKSHGYFADRASGCRRYVYCLSGLPVGTFTCEGGRRFDGRVCTDTEYCAGAPLSASGSGGITGVQFQQPAKQGFFADLSSGCRNYSFFIAGHETKLACPAGLIFNGQLCVSEGTYACPTG